MILKYVDDFTAVRKAWFNNQKLFQMFDYYLEHNNVELNEIDKHINKFIEELNVANTTKCGYRSILRTFIKFIYKTEGLGEVKEQDLDYNGERYILHSDGTYYKVKT